MGRKICISNTVCYYVVCNAYWCIANPQPICIWCGAPLRSSVSANREWKHGSNIHLLRGSWAKFETEFITSVHSKGRLLMCGPYPCNNSLRICLFVIRTHRLTWNFPQKDTPRFTFTEYSFSQTEDEMRGTCRIMKWESTGLQNHGCSQRKDY
jgi:hypothetical protein